jgi:DNA-binding PadR family transcriptional regulator
MSKSSALMDETPIMFQPSLAKLVGLHEAIVLQTLRFWCGNKKSGKVIDGERWIYNSAAEWQELSFPFWSTKTIGDLFLTLEKMGLVKSEQFDLKEGKARKYYTLTEAALTVLTIEKATHLEDSSTSIWKILPDHVEDSSRSARARHIKQYTENLTENTKPLTPFQGEEESSAVASHSSVELNQTNLFPTNPSEGHTSGSATAKLKSADGKETAPHCAAPPRNKKSPATQIEKPTGVGEQVWDDFIALRKAKRAPLSATALASIAKEAEKAAMHIEEALTECVTRGWQSFKAEWMKPKTTTKPERFSNF